MHRYYRPASLIAKSNNGIEIGKSLEFLAPIYRPETIIDEIVKSGRYSAADLSVLNGLK